jgi:hypothetical protein
MGEISFWGEYSNRQANSSIRNASILGEDFFPVQKAATRTKDRVANWEFSISDFGSEPFSMPPE